MERREEYIEILERRVGNYPYLIEMVKQCLHNDPSERPRTEELLTRLQGIRVEVEGQYGGDTIHLDLSKVKMAKELQKKERQIEELTQHQVWLSGY